MTDVAVTTDIKNLLVTAGIGIFGATTGWGIYIGSEPDTPDNTVTLYDTPGDTPNPKWLLDYPHFQVRVRSYAYLNAQQKIADVKSALLGLPSQTIGLIRYVGIYIVTDDFFLMKDEKERTIFISNWRVIREPSTGTNRRAL